MLNKKYNHPRIYVINEKEFPVSDTALVQLMQAVFSKGMTFRFKARGRSMHPFIRNDDIITVIKLGGTPPKLGEVVAFVLTDEEKLVVHRVVDLHGDTFRIKGDSISECPDGIVHISSILGRVIRIERDGQSIKFGMGNERYLLAWLSRIGILPKLCNYRFGDT